MSYPKPDRSDYTPSLTRHEDGTLDIWWGEGELPDGRPYEAEYWSDDTGGAHHLAVFFAREGLEFLDHLPGLALAALLERAGLVAFRGDKQFVITKPWTDPSGNDLWSVGVVLGDTDESYADPLVPLWNYRTRPRPGMRLHPSDDPRQLLFGLAYEPRGRWPEPLGP